MTHPRNAPPPVHTTSEIFDSLSTLGYIAARLDPEDSQEPPVDED